MVRVVSLIPFVLHVDQSHYITFTRKTMQGKCRFPSIWMVSTFIEVQLLVEDKNLVLADTSLFTNHNSFELCLHGS